MTSALLGTLPALSLARYLEDPGRVEIPISFVGIFVGLGIVAMWVRFPATGLYLDDDVIVVKSWWSTKRYPRSTLQRCRAEPYGGFFFILGWPVSGGMLQSGEILLEAGGYVRTAGGTVTSLGVTVKQAEIVNRWLGLSVGAGVGERRMRARRAGAGNDDRDQDKTI